MAHTTSGWMSSGNAQKSPFASLPAPPHKERQTGKHLPAPIILLFQSLKLFQPHHVPARVWKLIGFREAEGWVESLWEQHASGVLIFQALLWDWIKKSYSQGVWALLISNFCDWVRVVGISWVANFLKNNFLPFVKVIHTNCRKLGKISKGIMLKITHNSSTQR